MREGVSLFVHSDFCINHSHMRDRVAVKTYLIGGDPVVLARKRIQQVNRKKFFLYVPGLVYKDLL